MRNRELPSWTQLRTDDEMAGLAARFGSAIEEAVPRLAADPELHRDVVASMREQVAGVTAWLAHDRTSDPVMPAGAHDFARTLARRGLDSTVLITIHNAVQRPLLRDVAEHAELTVDRDERLSLLVHLVECALTWLNSSLEQMTATYREERERLFAGAKARRAELVQSILRGDRIDIDTASANLGYPLRSHHMALVLSTDDPADRDLDQRLTAMTQSIAASCGATAVLTTASGARGLWAWMSGDRELALSGRDGARIHSGMAGIRAAVGITGYGVDGFIRTHREALAAHRISETSPPGAIVHYRDVELLHLITADAEAYSAFRTRELRGLDGAEVSAVRLRQTLRTYIACNRNREETARQLGVHKNTVRNRLERVGELLGNHPDSRINELQLALLAPECYSPTPEPVRLATISSPWISAL